MRPGEPDTSPTSEPGAAGRFGHGPLSRASAFVYTLLVVEVLFLLALAPGLAVSLLLAPEPSNAPLLALCALPLGPALVGAVYALRHRRRDLAELKPAADFWHGYRAGFKGSLLVWVPALAWLTVVATVITNLGAAGVPRWWAGLLLVSGALACLWAVNALIITALFSFRARDVARLAGYAVSRRPVVALGTLGVLVAAALIALFVSEVVAVLLGSVLVAFLVRASKPTVAGIEHDFTTK